MTALWPQATLTYPSSDGEPVAETYAHLYALLITLEVLRQYLHRVGSCWASYKQPFRL